MSHCALVFGWCDVIIGIRFYEVLILLLRVLTFRREVSVMFMELPEQIHRGLFGAVMIYMFSFGIVLRLKGL